MPSRPRRTADPRVKLVMLLDRLSDRSSLVTMADIERAAARPSAGLDPETLPALIETAVDDSLLLKDLRTFYDRSSGATADAWVFRVNARHPIAAQLLEE